MAIRCGRCANYHEDTATVRACYNGEKVAVVDVGDMPRAGNRCTDKQASFINKLRTQLGRAELSDSELPAKREASAMITALQEELSRGGGIVPQRAVGPLQAVDYPAVAAGYYAVPSLTGNNDLDFFRVDAPDDGHWAGCLFVKRIIGGHDGAERVSQKTAKAWLELISAPHLADFASQKFGRELGRCGRCGRTLTDESSRARGIGPDCWARMEG
jgi:hypothetical protein